MKRVYQLLMASVLIASSCTDSSTNEIRALSTEETASPVLEKYNKEEKSSIIEGMKKAMVNFSEPREVRDLEDAKGQLQRLAVAWYQCRGMLIEAKADSSIMKMSDSATKVLSQFQKKMFPKYRQAFTDYTDEKLWIEDCRAHLSGENDDVLNLVGISFAPNRNKQESYETLLNTLKLYRFKKISFRTFKSSEDVTYFDIQSSSDTEYISMAQ